MDTKEDDDGKGPLDVKAIVLFARKWPGVGDDERVVRSRWTDGEDGVAESRKLLASPMLLVSRR